MRKQFGILSNKVGQLRQKLDRERTAVVALVQHLVDAWNKHDRDALASVFPEDDDYVISPVKP